MYKQMKKPQMSTQYYVMCIINNNISINDDW